MAVEPLMPSSATWEQIADLTACIKKACPWTVDRPSSNADWTSIAEAAVMLQRSDPLAVYAALALYMHEVTKGTKDHGPVERIDDWSKPMLVLRMMFDIPADASPTKISPDDVFGDTWRPAGCGGLPAALPDDLPQETALAFTHPVIWGNNGPSASCYRARAFMATGANYQPQREYLYFLQNCEQRSALERWLKASK